MIVFITRGELKYKKHLLQNMLTIYLFSNEPSPVVFCPFTGALCTVDVDECSGTHTPCKNGGTCINSHGGYRCICVNGWTGPDCSVNIDDCQIGPCYNGGTCHDRVGYYYCECPEGKTGMPVPNQYKYLQNSLNMYNRNFL